MNFWFDHCWTVLDSWVISSLVFQLDLFVSLPCSEGPKWVVSLGISAGFIGRKFGWLKIVRNGRFTRFKSARGRIAHTRVDFASTLANVALTHDWFWNLRTSGDFEQVPFFRIVLLLREVNYNVSPSKAGQAYSSLLLALV